MLENVIEYRLAKKHRRERSQKSKFSHTVHVYILISFVFFHLLTNAYSQQLSMALINTNKVLRLFQYYLQEVAKY